MKTRCSIFAQRTRKLLINSGIRPIHHRGDAEAMV